MKKIKIKKLPFILFIGILSILGFKGLTTQESKSIVFEKKEEKIFTPLSLFKNPYTLLNTWDTVPYPLSSYSAKEIEIQKELNAKEKAIIVYSPLGKEREWIEVDYDTITPYTWKWVSFDLPKRDGTLTKISLRRPNWWISNMKADKLGNKVHLDMPELGAAGQATVTKISPNHLDTRLWNENRQGDYVSRPITGKFEHESNEVYYLSFEGNPAPLGVTGNHPIWSIDRNGWAEAGNLQVGEKVKTQTGTSKLTQKQVVKGKQKVYNLEVYQDHNYLVSVDRILVHNHYIRNKALAGKKHPVTDVPFDSDGFPDFSDWLYGGGTNDVRINPTNSRGGDFAAANKAAGYSSTPKGYTWHHHQEYGRMQLVDEPVHTKTGHTGGFSLW
jgi:hypothetical protein